MGPGTFQPRPSFTVSLMGSFDDMEGGGCLWLQLSNISPIEQLEDTTLSLSRPQELNKESKKS